MKKRFVALLLVLVTVLSFSLSSCGDGDETATPPPNSEDDGGASDVRNELVSSSLSDVITMFRDALAGGVGLEGAADKLKISGSVPANTLLGTPEARLYATDGVIAFISGKDASYFAVKDGTLLKAESGGTSDVFEDLGISLDMGDIIAALGDAIRVSEEYFDLSEIKETDIVSGDDGVFYLADEYVRDMLVKAYAVVYLLSEGYTPEQLPNLHEDTVADATERAETFADQLCLRLGFILRARRITGMTVALSSENAGAISNERLESLELKASVMLNGTRDKLTEALVELSTKDKSLGEITLNASVSASYGTDGAPLLISGRADASVGYMPVASKDVESGDTVSVFGSLSASLSFGYNSRFTISGGNFVEFSVSSDITPISLVTSEGATVKDEERAALLDAKRYDKALTVAVRKNDKGAGIMPIYVKDGTLSASFTGALEYGINAETYDVPEDVKTALGKAAE